MNGQKYFSMRLLKNLSGLHSFASGSQNLVLKMLPPWSCSIRLSTASMLNSFSGAAVGFACGNNSFAERPPHAFA